MVLWVFTNPKIGCTMLIQLLLLMSNYLWERKIFYSFSNASIKHKIMLLTLLEHSQMEWNIFKMLNQIQNFTLSNNTKKLNPRKLRTMQRVYCLYFQNENERNKITSHITLRWAWRYWKWTPRACQCLTLEATFFKAQDKWWWRKQMSKQ